jgi:hypothetical protein
MPKPLMRSLLAIAVLLLFAASSALGARGLRSGRTRAGAHRPEVGAHRASRGRRAERAAKAGRRTHRRRETIPRLPLDPTPPLEPVSPVEPTPLPIESTPPFMSTVAIEPTTLPAAPIPPVEPVVPTEPTSPTPPAEPTTPAPEEKAKEVKAQEEEAKEEQAKEEQKKEVKGQEEKAREEKAKEEKAETEKIEEVKVKEEKVKEVKAKEEKAQDEKAKEEKAREEKAKEVKAAEEKAKEEKAKEEKTTTPTGCFENPETEGTSRFEACGYPGPKDTGVAETSGKTECSALPEYTGSKTISAEGTTIEGKEIRYTLPAYLSIKAGNVTLKDDCFLLKGEASSEAAIILGSNAKNVTIEHTTIRGENSTTQSFEVAIKSFSGPKVTVRDDRLEDCAECIQGSAEISGSYLLANRELGNTGLHRETVYMNTGSGNGEVPEETLIARNSTFLVPEASVAIVFANTGNGVYTDPCGSHITLEDNLLAGSGQMVQQCGSRSQQGSATLALKGNRVARCLTTPIENNASGMPNCTGSYFEGADSHGYFPYGGSLSVQDDRTNGPTGAAYVWEGNFWDNDLAAIAAPAP